MQCDVVGIPPPTVSYLVNTTMLTVTNGMTTLLNANVTNSGAYQCFAENVYGSVTASWMVTVMEPGEYIRKCGLHLTVKCSILTA